MEKQGLLFNSIFVDNKENVQHLKNIISYLSTQLYTQQKIINNIIKEKKDKKETYKNITLKEIGEKFLEYSKTNHTVNTYKRNITLLKNLKKFFGEEKEIDKITPDIIEMYKNKRKNDITPQGNKVSNGTINRELALLKALFNKAISWGMLDKNPFKNVRLLKEEQKSRIFLEKKDIEKILNSPIYKNHLYSHYKPMVYLAIYTGMRLSEILNLKWSDIDFINNYISIKHTKNKKVRNIPINKKLKDFLNKYKEEKKIKNKYVITNYKGEKINKIHNGWKNFLKKTGIKKYYKFHELRHTFASYLVMKGIDIVTIQKLLGHSNVKTTMIYSHIADKHKIEAVNNIDY